MKDKPQIFYYEIRWYSKVCPRAKFWHFSNAFYPWSNCSRDNSAVLVKKTWPGIGCLLFGIISLRYVMTSELSIDMNIHVCGAYYQFDCYGYQIVYKTPESHNHVWSSTSSTSVNGLAWGLGGNKSTYDSANSHKSSSSKWAALSLSRR